LELVLSSGAVSGLATSLCGVAERLSLASADGKAAVEGKERLAALTTLILGQKHQADGGKDQDTLKAAVVLQLNASFIAHLPITIGRPLRLWIREF
jgi:hypothetical protein